MDEVISPQNLSFVRRVIKNITTKLSIDTPENYLWLVFGSYVINMNNAGSDLDIICFRANLEGKSRLVYKFEGVPIHFTQVDWETLKDDGEQKLYGGYFTGKIINPHIFFFGNNKMRNTALFHAGKFIAPLAGYLSQLGKRKLLTQDQVTALVFVAFLSTDPSFDSYFLNYFSSTNFNSIWKDLCKETIKMLLISNSIEERSGRYIFTETLKNYKDFHTERMKISARHWSYGAVCHNNDYTFQDQIFSKAMKKMQRLDPSGEVYIKMLSFLKMNTGLKGIYI